jgi:CBS domain-containing protein
LPTWHALTRFDAANVSVATTRTFDERIGAMVVSHDGSTLDGIIAERDLAHGLAAYGDQLPGIRVLALMTKVVTVCSPEDIITEVMNVMTQRRIRHVPVMNGP